MPSRPQLILYIGIGVIFVIVLAVVLIVLGIGTKPPSPVPVTLEFWGFDDEEVFSGILRDFSSQFPHISVNYRQVDAANYENELLNRLAAGTGPDVFMLKSRWIIKHQDKLLPFPQQIFGFTPSDFKATFVDIAATDLLTPDNQILGFPIFVDTPVLFYNKDIFNTEGIAIPPKTWEEVLRLSQKLTRQSSAGDIIRSGIALGTANNIERWFEILSSLMLQEGVPIVDANGKLRFGERAAAALNFYASFADRTKANFSWTARMPNSLEAFASEKAAMVFGLVRDIPRIRFQNPRLNFGIAAFPQPERSSKKVVYGTYFFPAVSRLTRKPMAAWQLVLFLASRGAAEKYLAAVNLPASRRDLISLGATREILEIPYRQSLFAASWPVADEASTAAIFREAVDSVNTHVASPREAIYKLENRLRLLLP